MSAAHADAMLETIIRIGFILFAFLTEITFLATLSLVCAKVIKSRWRAFKEA